MRTDTATSTSPTASTARDTASTWYDALTLRERAASLRASATAVGAPRDPAVGARRLARWRAQEPFTSEAIFARRLAVDGLGEEELSRLLAETSADVKAREPASPAWLRTIARAYTRPAASSITFGAQADQTQVRFLLAVEPLISAGASRLRAGLERLAANKDARPAPSPELESALLSLLPGRLVGMLNRTLLLELHVARMEGRLQGDTPAARYRGFTEQLRRRDVALRLLAEYPVLARHVVRTIDQWVAASLELAARLDADLPLLAETFGGGRDPGALMELEVGGDRHAGGRAVAVLRFQSGLRVVYKPRSMAADIHFQELLGWVNAHGLTTPFRTLTILDRGAYGWSEFVEAKGCESPDELQRFYARQGGYLALLHAVRATDFHFENLIASGEHPVLIDLESLFHPEPEVSDPEAAYDAATRALALSPRRSGLLPMRLWADDGSDGVDMSGLGAVAGQLTPGAVAYVENEATDEMRVRRKRMPLGDGAHRPTLRGGAVDAAGYTDAIVAGFTEVYRLLLDHRDALLVEGGPVDRFAGDEIRVILRPTRLYTMLLEESWHPDALRSALDADRLFDRLWIEAEPRPYLDRVVAIEREDLIRGDVPRLTTRPASRDLGASDGVTVEAFFTSSGMEQARRTILAMSDADLDRQRWIVRASLTSLAIEAGHRATFDARPVAEAEPARDALVEAARSVGDRLEAMAIHGARSDEATWLGVMAVDDKRWNVVPLGADLYSGVPGVALFLAHLGAETGEARYTDLARAAVRSMERHLDRNRAAAAIGAYAGWGGAIYTLARLGSLWRDPALTAAAHDIVDRLPPLVDRDTDLDVLGGSAGAIGALAALQARAPSEAVRAVVHRAGERLLAAARPMATGLAWAASNRERPLAGFSHGAAGVAWALLHAEQITGDARFGEAATGAMAYERSLFSEAESNWPDLRELDTFGGAPFMTAWCHGAPGIGLARVASLGHRDDPAIRREIAAAVESTRRCGFGANHSLCHGDLGNAELLLSAGLALGEPRWIAEARAVGASVLATRARHGWLCGVPLHAETPGLLCGLAGVGLGLLRLASPERVPSVLTLSAT